MNPKPIPKPNRVRDAVHIRAKQARVVRRLSFAHQVALRYTRELTAYQNDLKDLVNAMSATELAAYHALLAVSEKLDN